MNKSLTVESSCVFECHHLKAKGYGAKSAMGEVHTGQVKQFNCL